MSTVRPNLNGVAQVPAELDGAVASTGFTVLRANPELLDDRYLFHWVRAEHFVSDMVRQATGASYPAVSDRIVKASRIPLPPLPEQRRIASILDRAEDLRRLRERSRTLTRELESRLFTSFFSDEISAEGSIGTIPLGKIALCSSGITKGRKTTDPTVATPYLAVSNVQDRRLDLSVVKHIDATEVERERFRLAPGDLLLTEGGDPDKLGRGTVWRGEIEGAIHQNHIFRVRVTNENYLPDYLNWLLASDYGKRYFMSRAKQTTGIATINQTQLRAFPVIEADTDRQRAFVRVIDALRASADESHQHLATLGDLAVSLRARAFRGEL